MQTTSTVATGNKGEVIAMHHLKKLGFEIVEMNYRFRHGEIDIVARDGETLVFCEVKMRMGDQFGEPEYAITQKKQQQIRKTARGYLYEHELKMRVKQSRSGLSSPQFIVTLSIIFKPDFLL